MPIHRKPRKTALSEFVSMIVPERIEEAYDRVEIYFEQYHHLSFESPSGVTSLLDELIRQNGEPVRKALYTLLCDPQSALRPVVRSSLDGGNKSAVKVLVPLIGSQFGFAPAVALQVAVLVVKAVTSGGEAAVCEELTQLHRKAARRVRAAERNPARPSRKSVPASSRTGSSSRAEKSPRSSPKPPGATRAPRKKTSSE